MNPIIFEYGPFSLHWYGLLIVGGAVVAAWIASNYAKRAGENPEHVWNLLAWSLVAGIIGARLYHVFSNPADGYGWPYYREHPLDIINFWNGGFRGLGIYGGLVGGVIAVVIYCWRNQLHPLRYLDFIAPNVLIAQAIGRLGNFANQELYGPPTTLPWAFHINPHYPCQLPPELPQAIQLCGTPNLTDETLAWYATHGYHPTFFYEAGWNLLMFIGVAWLIWRFGHRLRTGDGVLLYLLAYPLGRFWVEMFRPDAWVMGSLPTAQWIALGAILFSVVVFTARHWGWSWQDHPEDSLILLSRHRPTAAPTQATISI
ncbi:MAG: prolipoprotein diacylglyceryl transferase [Caldilineaceae bacterium]|nr:prolipoprotein diacylglyceryl transferase [Caldilineaceae bacterium]